MKSNRTSVITIVVTLLIGAGFALAGSQGGATIGGFPLFALAVIAALAIQVIAFVPAAALRTERFFDLTGSLTFIVISIALVLLVPQIDARGLILAAMVVLWAVRLGSFLFARVRRAGSDSRFEQIKGSPVRFLQVWVLQGLWVSITAGAAWIAMTVAPAQQRPLEWLGVVGIVVWVVGLTIEIVADAQKSAFRADPSNAGEFISTGLWARSRPPNYFGEIVLWIGVALVAVPVLQGWQWVALLSPVFVALLIGRVSGVPMLEAKADATWGGRDDYAAYKKRTPVLVPRLGASPARGANG